MEEPEEESSEEEEEELCPEEQGETRVSVSHDLRFTSGSSHTDCTFAQLTALSASGSNTLLHNPFFCLFSLFLSFLSLMQCYTVKHLGYI